MKKHFYTYYLFLFISFALNAQDKIETLELKAPKNTYASVFDQLQNGEQFYINYTSVGCFHQITEIMTFGKKNDSYYVQFKGKRKTITAADIKAIQKFEKELTLQKHLGCTTVDTYAIIYNNKKQSVQDDSCNWNGYYKLKKKFGFKSES